MEAQGAEETTEEPAVQNGEEADKTNEDKKQTKAVAPKTEEKPKKNKKADTSGGLASGVITLNIAHPTNPAKLKEMEEQIKQVPELRIVLIGGSLDEGTEIIVSAESPIPLLETLSGLPSVSEVNKKGKITQVVLKAD